jgi:capsule polysaccharide export protein KpsE/RkpR
MNRDYITKFDKWFKNIDNKSDKLILTSDIDSLASCYLLNLLFSCEVKGFYDLKGLSKLFNINLKLPTEQFYKYRELKNVGVDLNKINSKSLNKKKIFSSALVRKNFLKMSIV